VETNSVIRLGDHPIAVIGMGGIFPQAKNLREFWSNIVGGVDCITDVPETHWRIEDYYDPDPSAPDKTYCKRGGFLPYVEFDPMEFGLPPNILEVTDVSQILSLLVAKEALLDAGYLGASAEIRDRTGIVLGVGGGQKLIVPLSSRLQYPVWREALLSSGLSEKDADAVIEKIKLAYIRWEENSFPGMLGNVIAGRIANRFDLGGINCVTDAACASSMSALRLAISELVEGRADMMITGGVDTDNSIVMYMNFSKTPAFTKGDVPRPFDAESDGMMVGEGIGMMILKRLADAERDGDQIYAVIKGVGASSDGRFKSIYAPRGEGQEKALQRAYEDARIPASSISLFEAHGTGTVAGDTTEVTTAVRYFKSVDPTKQHIALGSVKSQIGHAKAAAGVAGMIKTALALHQKVLPPTINVDQPNPKFDLENSSFYINTVARPWLNDAETPRRAGISSFGFGGTNFHIVMEEYQRDPQGDYRLQNTAKSVILSAETPALLSDRVQQAIQALAGEDASQQFLTLSHADEAIPKNHARLGFVAANAEEALSMLQAAVLLLEKQPQAEEWQHPRGIYYRRSSMDTNGHVVALFAGQGSQYINMGRELALNFPEVRDAFTQVDQLMTADGQTPLSAVVYPHPSFNESEKQEQEAALQNTRYAQPAIGALTAGMYRMVREAGFNPDFTAGHSFGEVSALWAAGAISDQDYYRLIKARGAAMASSSTSFDAGTMLAVTGDLKNIDQDVAALTGIQIANRNSPTQVVLAGATETIRAAEPVLKEKGYRVVPLSVSAAFHTPLVRHAQQPFAQAVDQVSFTVPKARVYSNSSSQPYPADLASVKTTISEQMLQPVHFSQEIENIYNAGGSIFVEFGPRNVLTNLVKDILGSKPHVAIALNGSRQKDSDRQFREGIVQLQVLGLELKNIDPYEKAMDRTPKKKGMSYQLNGANFVSTKTREAYHQALNNGYQVEGTGSRLSASTPVAVVPPPIPVPPTPAPTPEPSPAPFPDPQPMIPDPEPLPEPNLPPAPEPERQPLPEPEVEPLPRPDEEPLPNPQEGDGTTNELLTERAESMELFDRTLAHLQEHQQTLLQAQAQFQQNQLEYFRIFFELTQQTLHTQLSAEVAASVQQSMMRFHDHQAETVKLHEQFIQQHNATVQRLVDVLRGVNVSSTSANGTRSTNGTKSASVPSAGTASNGLAAAPAAPSAAVTPPAPVKSQPVVAAPPATAVIPPVPVQSAAPAVEQKPAVPTPVAAATSQPQPTPVSTPASATSAPTVDPAQVAALSDAMLRIVGDKTGYPAEMLDLEMDMEADLGIDSIKRVEILGAMRDEFPQLPQFSPEELAELRTLGQIVDYMKNSVGGSNGSSSAPAVAVPPQQVSEPAQVQQPVMQPPAPAQHSQPAAEAAPASESSVAVTALSDAMLRIVGDKTGYPAEMLDLEMDMEADLGIDSIKRVEILGAMRDEFPQLPQFSPEELAELRTLGQIVDYMRESVGGSAPVTAVTSVMTGSEADVPIQVTGSEMNEAPAIMPSHVTETPRAASTGSDDSSVAVAALSDAMLRIVGDKTGYPAEMLDLEMDMEADLGIDSIKRVEILGAMRDEFPQLPQFSPEELAELRTLGQIVDYMRDSVGSNGHSSTEAADAPEVAHSNPKFTTPHVDPTQYGIHRNVANVSFLPVPDQLDYAVTPGSVCLITDDGTQTAEFLAQQLSATGWRAVVLSLPTTSSQNGASANHTVERIQLSDFSESSIAAVIQQLGQIGGFIHLNPSAGLSNGTMFLSQEKDLVKFAFLMAKHLKAPLHKNERERKFFSVVTRLDGALGTNGSQAFGTIASGLFGLVKTLRLEWSDVFCRAIDVAPQLSDQQVAQLINAELHDPNRLIVEVGYSTQGRVTLAAQEANLNQR
jgi:acyl transferase domain-containing protein